MKKQLSLSEVFKLMAPQMRRLLLVFFLVAPPQGQAEVGFDIHPDFPSLPPRASYRLVYNGEDQVCKAISKSLAAWVPGWTSTKKPSIYEAISWKRIGPSVFGNYLNNELAVIDPFPPVPTGTAKTNDALSLYAVKYYSPARKDDQVQFLNLLTAPIMNFDSVTQEFLRKSAAMDPYDVGYPLTKINPKKYPSGHFGKRDKITLYQGFEYAQTRIFDLVSVSGRVLVSMRSYNVRDMEIDQSYREWLIFAELPSVLDSDHFDRSHFSMVGSLKDVCYFVRKK